MANKKPVFADAIIIMTQLQQEIEACLDEDSEWTNDQGNGTNSFEASFVMETVLSRLQKVQDGGLDGSN